jgi:tetratricopeptide (TPR) repeat protein
MSDDIRGMTAQLAAEPASTVFVPLGEALRRRRQLDAALKVARAGLARHPSLPDAHDLLARILVDVGDDAEAFEAWTSVLELDPAHAGAHKGIGFLYFKAGELPSALRHLETAARAMPDDAGVRAAIARVRAAGFTPAPAPASALAGEEPGSAAAAGIAPKPEPRAEPAEPQVAAALDGTEPGLLLVDAKGLRLGGALRDGAGRDVADRVAAQLAGVAREADRAARLVGLGGWRSLAAECPEARLAIVAATPDAVLFAVRDAASPLGRAVRAAEQAVAPARRWLEGGT